MNNYVTGAAIKALREKKRLTQKQLADILCVSDKTVSKWETERGLPDIAILSDLAAALGVSVAELLSGKFVLNNNRAANIRKGKFYVCPVCQNILWSMGEGAFSCCGITLPPLELEEPENGDKQHAIRVERIEDEWCVTLDHPMQKGHYIGFLAFVTWDCVSIVRLYPEQSAQARFFIRGHGTLYAFCNLHGLFCVNTQTCG